MPRPLLALALLAFFYGVTFGLQTWRHRRATGSSGFVGVSGRPGSAAWTGGVLFVLGVALGLLAALGEWLGWIEPIVSPPTWVIALGVVVTSVGIVGTAAAQVSMGRSWRIGVRDGERTDLVTDGPFAVVRNPIFSCVLTVAAGLVLLLTDLAALTGFTALLVAVELQVRVVEEPHLLRVHGEAYRRYAGRVGRFVPGFGRI
ncbi:MAG: isoprenylcysteine carboxylmethyltransferase family protein [Nannocystaceae bacterium]